MRAIETFEIESGELSINVSVICFDCNDGFSDMWEGTDTHQGGVTITNREADRNSWKYFIPKQYTLADLAADYAKQGRENPSAAAYQSMQDQLVRDISASDYGFEVSAYVGGVEMLADTYVGCGFNYSYDDEGDLLDWQRLGLQYTATGYGTKIPTSKVIRWSDGRERRVYCDIYSNVGSCYCLIHGCKVSVERFNLISGATK